MGHRRDIKSSVTSVLAFNLSSYIADISIETVQQGFNWFLVGIRGLGLQQWCTAFQGRAYGYSFIIAALADGMSILTVLLRLRLIDRNQLIALLFHLQCGFAA